MTRRRQYALVFVALSICMALALGYLVSPQPFPTSDVPTWQAKSPVSRPRVPETIVPEGLAVLLVTILWTACRAFLDDALADFSGSSASPERPASGGP
jgi:hypothetical protein